MIGVNSVQSTSKVRVRTSGSVKYSREDSIRRQSHRSKSMKISNSSEFSAKDTKALYNSIKNEKLEWAVDDEEKKNLHLKVLMRRLMEHIQRPSVVSGALPIHS